MAQSIEIIEGTPGITDHDVAHLIIPGRYRSPDGMGLHPFSEQRVATAADFYVGHVLAEKSGFIICSGYKNPGDEIGEPWRDDESGVEYQGIPEAISMRTDLVQNYDISAKMVQTEVGSVDTVTNFTNSQNLFPDDRPVGIVAQEQHLDRILKIIAPRTMRRDYLGIVVPELPGNIDEDGLAATLVSHYIARGLTPENPNASRIAEERATRVWRAVLGTKSLMRLGPLTRAVTAHSKPSS